DLVELNSSIRLLGCDDGIAKVDEIFLLHVEQFLPNFLRLGLGWEFDNDEIAHDGLSCYCISPSSARRIRLQSHWCFYSRKNIHLSGEGLSSLNANPNRKSSFRGITAADPKPGEAVQLAH